MKTQTTNDLMILDDNFLESAVGGDAASQWNAEVTSAAHDTMQRARRTVTAVRHHDIVGAGGSDGHRRDAHRRGGRQAGGRARQRDPRGRRRARHVGECAARTVERALERRAL
jgi:hypothetical protein